MLRQKHVNCTGNLFLNTVNYVAAGLDPSDIGNAPFLWHKGDDYVKAGTPIPLMYRMATAADVKPGKGRKLSRHLWKLPPKQVLGSRQLCKLVCVGQHSCLVQIPDMANIGSRVACQKD